MFQQKNFIDTVIGQRPNQFSCALRPEYVILFKVYIDIYLMPLNI